MRAVLRVLFVVTTSTTMLGFRQFGGDGVVVVPVVDAWMSPVHVYHPRHHPPYRRRRSTRTTSSSSSSSSNNNCNNNDSNNVLLFRATNETTTATVDSEDEDPTAASIMLTKEEEMEADTAAADTAAEVVAAAPETIEEHDAGETCTLPCDDYDYEEKENETSNNSEPLKDANTKNTSTITSSSRSKNNDGNDDNTSFYVMEEDAKRSQTLRQQTAQENKEFKYIIMSVPVVAPIVAFASYVQFARFFAYFIDLVDFDGKEYLGDILRKFLLFCVVLRHPTRRTNDTLVFLLGVWNKCHLLAFVCVFFFFPLIPHSHPVSVTIYSFIEHRGWWSVSNQDHYTGNQWYRYVR